MHIHIIQYYMLCIYIYCLECQHAHRYMNHKWIPHKFIGTHRPFDPPEALDPNFVAEIYFTLAFLTYSGKAIIVITVIADSLRLSPRCRHPWRSTKRKSTEIIQNPKYRIQNPARKHHLCQSRLFSVVWGDILQRSDTAWPKYGTDLRKSRQTLRGFLPRFFHGLQGSLYVMSSHGAAP